MEINQLKKQIQIASGKRPADLVIKNCRIVNVFTHTIEEEDIAICDGIIAATGHYSGLTEIDANQAYAIPGLIESHIHIECSFLTPEEFGKLVLPCGTTTAIADPHEITNVLGIKGLNYMLKAAEQTDLDIKYMIPSCVPSTPYETSGAFVNAAQTKNLISTGNFQGLAEFMDYTGIFDLSEECLNKILAARNEGKIVDGHAPGLTGYQRKAYITAGINTDHECTTKEEMLESLKNGMYVQLRDGSACHDLENLIPYITNENSRRCLLCSDERLPDTILKTGHLDNHLRICVKNGLNPITAVQMATINAAECYHLYDRGAIAAGYRADIVLVNNLTDFKPLKVFTQGKLAAENGICLLTHENTPVSDLESSINTGNFSPDKLKLCLKGKKVHAIEIQEGSLITSDTITEIETDSTGNFKYSPDKDLVKIAVIERHHGTGNTGIGILKNYGLKKGAIALSVAHDSHNIICVGTNDEDMEQAVKELISMKGGIVLVNEKQVIDQLPLPVAGLMSLKDGKSVAQDFNRINSIAVKELGVNPNIEPIGTLCFMSLPVIPELKLTDMGLFNVSQTRFINLEP